MSEKHMEAESIRQEIGRITNSVASKEEAAKN
jgi:hypothetical protein